MSSVLGVQSVNSMLEAKKAAVGSPNRMFQAILEEKLGVSSSSYGSADYSSLYSVDSSQTGWDELVNDGYANIIAKMAAEEGTGSSGETKYDEYIAAAAKEYGVAEELIKAVIACESSFNPNAVSKSGAVGLMQLMPATAKGLGVTNSYDPQQNIMGGTKYLSSLVENFDGDLILALAGYNMGGTRVAGYGITPNSNSESAYDAIPDSVMSYAKKVISKMAQYGG